jgi:transcriptional regulator with XRE-family HTH domain
MITVEQIRAGRALLGWSQLQLAEASALSVPSVKRLELGNKVTGETLGAVRSALEKAGVEFIEGPGVRFRLAEVYANPLASSGVWGVVTRWEVGAPLQWVTPETARTAAATAERRGDSRLPILLREAADEADRNNRDAARSRRRS